MGAESLPQARCSTDIPRQVSGPTLPPCHSSDPVYGPQVSSLVADVSGPSGSRVLQEDNGEPSGFPTRRPSGPTFCIPGFILQLDLMTFFYLILSLDERLRSF